MEMWKWRNWGIRWNSEVPGGWKASYVTHGAREGASPCTPGLHGGRDLPNSCALPFGNARLAQW